MVKVQPNKEHNYYLDGYLKANLDNLINNVKKDYDAFVVISGREGFGKSVLASQVAMYLDPTYNIDRCCFTSEQFIEACKYAKKFQAVVFDETMGYLSSRGAMSKFNKSLIKIMAEMRSKNLFVILCIPNFFELDRYPAMWRTTGLLHIYRRSFFGSYDFKAKKRLYLAGKKFYAYTVPPNFKGRFVKYFTLDKEEYEEKKQVAINSWSGTKEDKFKELFIETARLLISQYKYTHQQIVDHLKKVCKQSISRPSLSEYLKEKSIENAPMAVVKG